MCNCFKTIHKSSCCYLILSMNNSIDAFLLIVFFYNFYRQTSIYIHKLKKCQIVDHTICKKIKQGSPLHQIKKSDPPIWATYCRNYQKTSKSNNITTWQLWSIIALISLTSMPIALNSHHTLQHPNKTYFPYHCIPFSVGFLLVAVKELLSDA